MGAPGSPYGPPASAGPPGLAAKLLSFCEELRGEGVAVGTSEILDAFAALEQVPWSAQEDFRECLAATIAKSQEDRRVFELLFDRFFFRAAEGAAVEHGIAERGEHHEGGERLDIDQLREQIREAILAGNEGEMRDLARLAIAAFGRRAEGSGVVGVDVQRIRRTLGELFAGSPPLHQDESDRAWHESIRDTHRLRAPTCAASWSCASYRADLHPTPLATAGPSSDRALPDQPTQDLAAVQHRAVVRR